MDNKNYRNEVVDNFKRNEVMDNLKKNENNEFEKELLNKKKEDLIF